MMPFSFLFFQECGPEFKVKTYNPIMHIMHDGIVAQGFSYF